MAPPSPFYFNGKEATVLQLVSECKVYEDDFGICRCEGCDAELVCNENGDMPDNCPKCKAKLDWSFYAAELKGEGGELNVAHAK